MPSVVERDETDVLVWLGENRFRCFGILRPIYILSVEAVVNENVMNVISIKNLTQPNLFFGLELL